MGESARRKARPLSANSRTVSRSPMTLAPPLVGSRVRTVSSRRSASGATCRTVAKARGAAEQRQAVTLVRIGAECRGFGVDQATVAANTPVVAEAGAASILTHRLATKQDRLDGGQRGAFGEIDFEPAIEPGALEQDGLLRQPVDVCAGRGPQLVFDHSVATERTVHPLARRRSDHQFRAGSGFDRPPNMVTAGKSTGSVHEHRLQRVGMRMRQPDLGAALLIKPLDLGLAVARCSDDTALAPGALEGRSYLGRRDGGEDRHVTPSSADAPRADRGRWQVRHA